MISVLAIAVCIPLITSSFATVDRAPAWSGHTDRHAYFVVCSRGRIVFHHVYSDEDAKITTAEMRRRRSNYILDVMWGRADRDPDDVFGWGVNRSPPRTAIVSPTLGVTYEEKSITWAKYPQRRPLQTQMIVVPLVIPLAISIIVAVAWAWTICKRRNRWARRVRFCAHCGYDLRASPEYCPECGTSRGSDEQRIPGRG